ncbi:MAG TPA: vWA domain-containing protein, partial [Chitinophagaceae bacterium]
LWPNVHDSTERSYRIVMRDAKNIDHPVPVPDGINVLVVNDDCASPRAVDIVVAVDATGSMYGEIDFLKIELENVLRNTFSAYPELNLHAGSVFYRDRGDEYVARWTPLQTDLLKVLNFIKLQRATGGGDVPEAVHIALQTAIDTLKWRDDARTRILLLVTDAPPHLETRDRLYELISKASERGIRVVPVICMGADKSTEYFMRCLSVLTNGTYVFLADDSNADFSPAQPGQLVLPVQFLSSLLERVIREMVTAENCSLPAMQAAAQQPAGDVRLSVASRKMLLIEATPSIHEGYITDNSGRILLKVLRPFGKLKWLIDLSALGNGSYFFRYRGTDAAMHTVRFAWNR